MQGQLGDNVSKYCFYLSDTYLTIGVEIMKKPYRIFSLFFVLLLSVNSTFAGDNNSNAETNTDIRTLGNGGGVIIDPTSKESGMIAFGGGGGIIIEPSSASVEQTQFCILGFCLNP